MLKKEEWAILGIFLLFASLLLFFDTSGLTGITGLAAENSSEPSFDVVLTNTQVNSGDALQGYLNITFAGPFDPLTWLKVEFNDVSRQTGLKDYFNSKNISFKESESSFSAFNPSDSKTLNFESSGSKSVAFKLPKSATVSKFSMTVTGSSENPPSFVSFDVADYTNKKEWKYFGDFISFNQDYIYPSSLNVNQEGDPATIGGQEGSNATYFCEAINLPESKHFQLGAKLRKVSSNGTSDIKAVLLSFDGEYASGGADFCDLPEPESGAASNWYTCDLTFSTAKQGTYLVCVYYKGSNENQYYELSRGSTASTSRFECPITSGSSLCFQSSSKDYFIGVKAANYTGVLNKAVGWGEGVTDQEMAYSLTGFLQGCKADEIGDCIVPVTISSGSAGTLQLSGSKIEYTEQGGASSYSNKLYDITQVPGMIVSLGGVSLENVSKMIQISLSEFNLTAPNITEVSKNLPLAVSLTPGEKITKIVKVFGEAYAPETGTVEEKITNAKKVISDMESEHGSELGLFGIDFDTKQLDSFESEVNKLKSDTNLSVEEANSKLDTLAEQINTYLQGQPKSFSVDTSFKDLYIPEPGSVEKVVVENAQDVYFYQSNVEVSVEVSNYVLEKYDGSKEKYSTIKKSVIPQKTLSSVYVYEIIPKTLVNNVVDIFFENGNYETVQQDPIIRYTFTSLSQPQAILYGVKGVTVTPNMLSSLGSIVVPIKEEVKVVKEEYKCGDGVCTKPYEDETVCPGDCGRKTEIPWNIIIALVVLLVIGIVYINFYRGKGAFRQLISRSPFSNPRDLESVKHYITTAQNKGEKKQAIASALLKSGWTREQIVYVFEDLEWDEKRLFTIRVAPSGGETVRKLQAFIKQCLQLNISKEKIVNTLMQKGWSTDKIDDAFAEVGEPEEKIETEKEKSKKISYYFEKKLEEEMKK